MISKAWGWIVADTERFKAVLTAASAVIAAVIAAVVGTILTKRYSARRDMQDRESQWRSHAVELTKLDLHRKLALRSAGDHTPMRPSILDFLANYRDLQELGAKSPKELYALIEEQRIAHRKTKAAPTPEAPVADEMQPNPALHPTADGMPPIGRG